MSAFRIDVDLLKPNESPDGYIDAVSAAFENYEVMVRAFKECPGPRIDWIRKMLSGSIDSKRKSNTPVPVARIDGRIVSGANLYMPDIEFTDDVKAWWPRFLEEAGPGTQEFFARFLEQASSVELPPNILLAMIGVHPEFQGRGVGRKMIEFIIQMAADHPVAEGVGLDTEIPQNVPLYEKFGFKVMGPRFADDMPIWVRYRANC